MKFAKHQAISVIPFIMLGVTAICGYMSSLDIYHKWFNYLSDILGYSILTNIVFMFLYFRKSFCPSVKFAVIGLMVMNIVSMLTLNTEYYNSLNDIWITLIVGVLTIVYKIKRW